MLRRYFLLLLAFLLLFSSFAAAVTTYPYVNLNLNLPGSDNPYPGMGTGYSSLGSGIRTVMWNPAGLAKIKASEAYLGATTTPLSISFNKQYSVNDLDISVTGTSSLSASNYINRLLFTDDTSATSIATREFIGSGIYTPASSGLDYKQAIKIADWLSLGISSRGEVNASATVAGTFPSQYYSHLDLYGASNFLGTGMSFNNDGKLTYAFDPGGGIPSYTYTSESSAWSGFLRQTSRIPFSAISDAQDSLNINSNLTFTGASKFGGLSLGLNLTPISASMSIDNTVKAIVNSGTTDQFFYAPNFDPNDESDVLQWINDPNKYGTELGYTKRYIRVPAGESVAEGKYTGFYNARTVRTDIGAMFDLGEFVTVAMAFENIGASALNFDGVGRVAYVNTRINTSEAVNIIDPANTSSWSPFTDTFSPMVGTENIGMLPQINISLPKKTKIGLTLRRPLLITFDYEVQTNPISVRVNNSSGQPTDVVLSNLRILRGGLETQVFVLPLWLRMNAALLWKPETTGLDAQGQTTFNKAFVLLNRFAPLSGDIGLGTNLWGYKTDIATGVDGSSVLSMIQMDTLSNNFNKFAYYNLTVNKDNWYFVLQNTADVAASAAAYNNASENDRKDVLKIVKWISTLTVGFKF